MADERKLTMTPSSPKRDNAMQWHWHADSSWMWVAEFTRAMPVESSTRPAEYQRADRDNHRSRSLSETKASYRESRVTSQSKARMDRCKGRNDFARKNWASAYCRHLPRQFRAGQHTLRAGRTVLSAPCMPSSTLNIQRRTAFLVHVSTGSYR